MLLIFRETCLLMLSLYSHQAQNESQEKPLPAERLQVARWRHGVSQSHGWCHHSRKRQFLPKLTHAHLPCSQSLPKRSESIGLPKSCTQTVMATLNPRASNCKQPTHLPEAAGFHNVWFTPAVGYGAPGAGSCGNRLSTGEPKGRTLPVPPHRPSRAVGPACRHAQTNTLVSLGCGWCAQHCQHTRCQPAIPPAREPNHNQIPQMAQDTNKEFTD